MIIKNLFKKEFENRLNFNYHPVVAIDIERKGLKKELIDAKRLNFDVSELKILSISKRLVDCYQVIKTLSPKDSFFWKKLSIQEKGF